MSYETEAEASGTWLLGAKERAMAARAKSRSLRDDNQKSKGKSNRRSRFPEGMTERKARARAKTTARAKTNTGVSTLRCTSVEMTSFMLASSGRNDEAYCGRASVERTER